MRLAVTSLTPREQELQEQVRSFLKARLAPGSYPLGLGMAGAVDPAFSKDLGEQGWLGMSLPTEYGGGGRSAVERLIVVEELLARGAPVGHHWVADRQSGPSIAQHGTEEQKRRYLPGIASGELCFAIGMSEPGAGSDLAALRTSARPVDGGWVVNGMKIWTSGAAHASYILALIRTSEHKHAGLTQFIVPCDAAGLRISTIPFIDGSRDFCEVFFDEVFLSDAQRLGDVGGGWAQNISELALERGGVDRWMTLMPLLNQWVAAGAPRHDEAACADLGLIAARGWAFRSMSLSIARMVDDGMFPVTEAALLKEMATRFEQDCVRTVAKHLGRVPDLWSPDPFESLLARAMLVSPSWTIRGGTVEILRNLIAKAVLR